MFLLIKIARNRVVEINGQKGQLQKLLRLVKNSKSAMVTGSFCGTQCYFYVCKVKPDCTSYFICSDLSEKQLLHESYAMHAYAVASVFARNERLKSVDHAVNILQDLKTNYITSSKSLLNESFTWVA